MFPIQKLSLWVKNKCNVHATANPTERSFTSHEMSDCPKTTHSDVIITEINAKMGIMQIRIIKRTLITRTGSYTRSIHIRIKREINPTKLALTLTRLF